MINLHHQHQTQQGSVIFKETVLSYKSKRNLINYFINNNNTAILPSTTSTRRGLDRPLLTLVSNLSQTWAILKLCFCWLRLLWGCMWCIETALFVIWCYLIESNWILSLSNAIFHHVPSTLDIYIYYILLCGNVIQTFKLERQSFDFWSTPLK